MQEHTTPKVVFLYPAPEHTNETKTKINSEAMFCSFFIWDASQCIFDFSTLWSEKVEMSLDNGPLLIIRDFHGLKAKHCCVRISRMARECTFRLLPIKVKWFRLEFNSEKICACAIWLFFCVGQKNWQRKKNKSCKKERMAATDSPFQEWQGKHWMSRFVLVLGNAKETTFLKNWLIYFSQNVLRVSWFKSFNPHSDNSSLMKKKKQRSFCDSQKAWLRSWLGVVHIWLAWIFNMFCSGPAVLPQNS